MSDDTPLDYASARVDTCAGDRAVELMKEAVSRMHDASVLNATGGFAGLVDASAPLGMERPLLVTSTDGVGTKIAITQQMDIHDVIDQDLVGTVVDDIAVIGACPVLMTDYIACGHVIPECIATIVTGIARACEATDTPLVGGETAEYPGVMDPDDYDIAGVATGVADAPKLLGPNRAANGDVLIVMTSSGLYLNGYSLVRLVVARTDLPPEAKVEEFGRTFGGELLEPTCLYTKFRLDVMDTLGAGEGASGIYALSHVTGGGPGANLSRVLPLGVTADADHVSWIVPPVLDWVRRGDSVTWTGTEDSLNLGVGMVGVIGAQSVEEVLCISRAAGADAWAFDEAFFSFEFPVDSGAFEGRVVSGTRGVNGGVVCLRGDYRVG